jgi:hypothetical protein
MWIQLVTTQKKVDKKGVNCGFGGCPAWKGRTSGDTPVRETQ